jgi:hypothetical protein
MSALASLIAQIPAPPVLHPIASHEAVVTGIVGAVFLACLAITVYVWIRHRNPIGVFLLAGGCIASFQEPMVDVLGNIFVHSDLTVFTTFGRPMPVWAILAYGVFWGFQPFALHLLAERGFDMRTYRLGIAACFVLNLLIEWPILQTDIYLYFGRQPFEIFGFPLIWLFINCTGMVLVAVAIHTRRPFFTGARTALAVIVPVVLVPAGSLASGLPVMSALQSPAAPDTVLWLTAVVTAAIAMTIIELAGRTLARSAGGAAVPPASRRAQAPEQDVPVRVPVG